MCDGVNGSDDTMAASAVLCAVFMVLLCTVHGQTPVPENGYEFPERFSAIATGFVWDALVGLDEPGESVGYMYTDYSIPAQRVDEVWNYTSILGTHFGARGISSDTHLFFKVRASSSVLLGIRVGHGDSGVGRLLGGMMIWC